MRTVVDRSARTLLDGLPSVDAVVSAWADLGRVSSAWKQKQQDDVRRAMPLLADALDRLAAERSG